MTATVRRGDAAINVYASGSLASVKQVVVSTEAFGQIKKIHVKLGDVVKKGDLLAEIDSESAGQTLDRARASYKSSIASLKASESNMTLRQRELSRVKVLVASEVVSAEDLDRAQAAFDAAQATRDADIARSDVASLDIKLAETALKHTRIVAPIDGEVTILIAREGQAFVASQQTTNILILSDLSTMVLYTRISEADILKINKGQQLSFTTPTGLGHSYSAQIHSVETSATNALSGNEATTAIEYNVLADIDNKARELRPGMRADVVINLASSKNTLLLPVTALQNPIAENRYPVTKISADGSTAASEITVGLVNETEAEVLDGLAEGDTILISSSGGTSP